MSKNELLNLVEYVASTFRDELDVEENPSSVMVFNGDMMVVGFKKGKNHSAGYIRKLIHGNLLKLRAIKDEQARIYHSNLANHESVREASRRFIGSNMNFAN